MIHHIFSMIKLDLKRITRIIINSKREKHIQKTQFIRAPAQVVISTVSDVQSYSTFVPFCKKSTFEQTTGVGILQVGFGPLNQSWKSQVQIQDNVIKATNEGQYPLTNLNTGLKNG